jgi:hypothetical protein
MLGKRGKSCRNQYKWLRLNESVQIPEHPNDYFINIGLNLAADLTCKFSCFSVEFFCSSADINSQFNLDLIVECNFLRSTKL